MMRNLLCLFLAVALVPACGGSGGGDEPSGAHNADAGTVAPDQVTARFAIADDPALTALAHIPWPSDVYLTEDGHLDLRGFPRPTRGGLLELLVTAAETHTVGFGTSATLYVSFNGPINQAKLPDSAMATTHEDATVFLIDVDPASPERGKRWPYRWRYQASATSYLPANTLSLRPVEGLTLRPATTYALVVTEDLVKPTAAFVETLGDTRPAGALGQVWDLHAPLRAWLGESGVQPAVASVFTTQDPVGELFSARDFIQGLPLPSALWTESRGCFPVDPNDPSRCLRYELFEGEYDAPRFQAGEIPYTVPGEGAMAFDKFGVPEVQGTEHIRFGLSLPTGVDADGEPLVMPPNGWPLAIYAHGTGGDYESIFRGDIASTLARYGIAVLSFDQIHHGTRDNGACDNAPDSSCVEMLFFNVLNPVAARDNQRQAALDLVSLRRFSTQLEVDPDVSVRGVGGHIDPTRVMVLGHSQGGLNGALFLGIEPEILGGVLSGAGAGIAITVEAKKQPVDINALMKSALALPATETLNRWHPTLMLLQTFVEPGDPVNYGRYWFDEPPAGARPKSVLMTAGLLDQYTPVETIFALAAAARLPIIAFDGEEQAAIEGLELQEIGTIRPGTRGNVGGGDASAGLAQYAEEGHFVIFEVPSAKNGVGLFLKRLAFDRPPRLF